MHDFFQKVTRESEARNISISEAFWEKLDEEYPSPFRTINPSREMLENEIMAYTRLYIRSTKPEFKKLYRELITILKNAFNQQEVKAERGVKSEEETR